MLSKMMSLLPFWKAFSYYSWASMREALGKFLVLWVMSLAPLLVAAALQEMPSNENSLWAFVKHFGSSFLGTHQFIYAVSFITPIFYLLWERHQGILRHVLSGKRSLAGVKLTPPGFGAVLIWSSIFFVITTVAYAVAVRPRGSTTSLTILEAGSLYSTILVYLFGLLCWYYAILDGDASPVAEYFQEVKHQKEEEEEQAQEFSGRIATSEEEGA